MSNVIITKNGYDFYNVTSALQKSIRRNKPDIAGFFALELFMSNYQEYVWKRLLTISAEDCYSSTITTEIYNLYRSYILVKGVNKDVGKCRIFLAKAVLILCRDPKNRDADHLTNLVYDRKNIDEKEVEKYLKSITDSERKQIPEYTFDIHTKRGRIMGKTKEQFFQDEFNALEPKQKGLFDVLVK